MFDFMWGYVMGQRSAAQAAAFTRSAASADAVSTSFELNNVDERVDRLLLLVEAMWSLLREQGLSDDQLIARLVELDEADGVNDGRHTPLPSDCPSCGSKVAAGLSTCQFCGTAVPTRPGPFDGLG